MIGCLDLWLVVSYLPLVVIVAAAMALFVVCVIYEWDQHKTRVQRAEDARRRWSGMDQADR